MAGLALHSLSALSLIVLLIALPLSTANTDTLVGFRYDWVLLAGSPDGNDRPYAIDVDSHGNPVLAGMLQNNASFGNLVLDLNRKRSAFASKVDRTAGLPVWVNVQLPAPDGTASAVDVAVDGEDNIVVMGTFKGNMQLGPVALTGNPTYGSVFLARYHHNGTLLWATEVNGTGSALVWGCAIGIEPLEGSLYLGGYFGQQVYFENEHISSQAVQMFLASYDLNSGVLRWVSNGLPTTGTTLPSYATDITMQFQNPLVIGTFFEYLQLGNFTLNTTSGSRGIFVARFDSTTGAATEARSINGTGICFNFHQVDTDAMGNHLMAGCFSESITFSHNVTIVGSPLGNVYLVKYDSRGDVLWATYVNSLASKYYTIALCTDLSGNVYLAGYYAGVLRLNGTVLRASQDSGIYVIKLAANGTLLWADVIPGLFGVQKMAAYGNNTVYLAGSFRGEASVGGHYIYSLAEEIFLFKITAYEYPAPLSGVADGLSYKLGVPLLLSMVAALLFFVFWQYRRDKVVASNRLVYEEMQQ